jgi:DNA-binding transcriptional LysR family regulator
MRALNLGQLQTLADVIELGSFSAAAERAGLSQPAISLQVRQLERHLGVRLVERVGRRAQATRAGHELLIHSRRIQEDVAQALEAIAPHKAATLDRIRIGTGATACIHLLPPILKRLKEQLPGIEISVQTGNTPDILKLLEANALDLAIATLPTASRSLEVVRTIDDELMAVFPVEERSLPKAVTRAVLATKPLLLYEGGGNTRRIINKWFAQGGQAPKPVMELGSVEAIKELVGAGLGWAVLPKLALKDISASSAIQARSLSPRLVRSLGVVLRRDKHLSRGLRQIIGALGSKA